MKVQKNPLALTSCSAKCDQTVLTLVARVSGSRKSVERFYSLTRVNSRVGIKYSDLLNAKLNVERCDAPFVQLLQFQHVGSRSDATLLDDSSGRSRPRSGEYFFGFVPFHGSNPSDQHITFPRCAHGHPHTRLVVLPRNGHRHRHSLGRDRRSVQVDIALWVRAAAIPLNPHALTGGRCPGDSGPGRDLPAEAS